MSLSLVILCNISLCISLRDSVGVSIGIFLACSISVFPMVWEEEELRWVTLVVLNKNNVCVIGDLVQS